MVNDVLMQNDRANDVIFEAYFLPNMRDTVNQVLLNLVHPANMDPTSGADYIGTITVDGNDFRTDYSPFVGSYTKNDLDSGAVTMHFRQNDAIDVFRFPSLSDIRCENLDPSVSWKILSLGYMVLHELT